MWGWSYASFNRLLSAISSSRAFRRPVCSWPCLQCLGLGQGPSQSLLGLKLSGGLCLVWIRRIQLCSALLFVLVAQSRFWAQTQFCCGTLPSEACSRLIMGTGAILRLKGSSGLKGCQRFQLPIFWIGVRVPIRRCGFSAPLAVILIKTCDSTKRPLCAPGGR